jgi:hypothetical protein
VRRFTWPLVVLVVALTAALSVAVATASAGGGNSANAKLCQSGGWQNLFSASTGLAFTSDGQCVSNGARGNTYSSLTVSTTVSGNAWGAVSGFGLQPGSTVTLHYTIGGGFVSIPMAVQSDGTIARPPMLACGVGDTNAFAVGATSGGAPITSNVVNSLCG